MGVWGERQDAPAAQGPSPVKQPCPRWAYHCSDRKSCRPDGRRSRRCSRRRARRHFWWCFRRRSWEGRNTAAPAAQGPVPGKRGMHRGGHPPHISPELILPDGGKPPMAGRKVNFEPEPAGCCLGGTFNHSQRGNPAMPAIPKPLSAPGEPCPAPSAAGSSRSSTASFQPSATDRV